jgi:hypothetical protein
MGLETMQEFLTRSKFILYTQMIVMKEQERQQILSKDGKVDSDELARVYCRISFQSQRAARNRGLNEEILVKNLELTEDEDDGWNSIHSGNKTDKIAADAADIGSFSTCLGQRPMNGSAMKNRRWSAIENRCTVSNENADGIASTPPTKETPVLSSKKGDLPLCALNHLQHHHPNLSSPKVPIVH